MRRRKVAKASFESRATSCPNSVIRPRVGRIERKSSRRCSLSFRRVACQSQPSFHERRLFFQSLPSSANFNFFALPYSTFLFFSRRLRFDGAGCLSSCCLDSVISGCPRCTQLSDTPSRWRSCVGFNTGLSTVSRSGTVAVSNWIRKNTWTSSRISSTSTQGTTQSGPSASTRPTLNSEHCLSINR